MNRFIIVDGLPYLFANGKAYKVRWNEEGFTVGSEVKLASVPSDTFSELSIMAKCAGNLDSIAEQVAGSEKEPDFDEMKLADLKEYAKANGINLNGARTKAEIIEAIKSIEK